MLAALRAELLVLRKWPAAWGLLLVVPVLTLLTYYVDIFVLYLTITPAEYAQEGSPSQLLPGLLPSQFVIVSLTQFTFGLAPFVVLGAVLAGGDWARGTIGTSLLAGAGRVRTWAGQAFALAAALAASVVATFAVSAGASLAIRALEARSVNLVDGAWPDAWVITRGLGVAMLVALAYGALGLALGTVCRSAAGGIAAALLWTLLLEPILYELGLNTGGTFQRITDFLPATSASTVTGLFGSPGGGATSSEYLAVRPALAAWALAGYTVAFSGLALALLYRRDVLTARTRRHRRPAPAAVPAGAHPPALAPAADRGPVPPGGTPAPATPAGGTRASGVLAALRAELLVMRHRPAVLALVLALPVNMLLSSYLNDYVYYLTAGKGTVGDGLGSPQQVLPALLPGQYLTSALSGFSTYSGLYGPAVLFLLGALIAGTDWGRGTLRTALLQGPGRLQTRFGQDLAVMGAAAAAVALTFVLAAAASAVISLAVHGGSALPQANNFPVPAHVAGAVAGALLLALACSAIGLALGTILRSATRAAAAVLLWAVVIQPSLDQIGTQLHGVVLRLYEVLPDASINTIASLYNTTTTFVPGTTVSPPNEVVQVTPALAFGILGGYLLAFLAIPAVLTRRRSIS